MTFCNASGQCIRLMTFCNASGQCIRLMTFCNASGQCIRLMTFCNASGQCIRLMTFCSHLAGCSWHVSHCDRATGSRLAHLLYIIQILVWLVLLHPMIESRGNFLYPIVSRRHRSPRRPQLRHRSSPCPSHLLPRMRCSRAPTRRPRTRRGLEQPGWA